MDATNDVITYAAKRDWKVADALDINRYSALSKNWETSKTEITKIQEAFRRSTVPDGVITLAVAGSLGRMEAAEGISDCDLLVVCSNDLEDAKRKLLYDEVWRVLVRLDIVKPKPTGAFSEATSIEQLCEKKNIGAFSEDMRVLAKRLLLLLETQPVYETQGYQRVINKVVDSYAEHYVAKDPRKEWGFLINDLSRYFRSLCVNYQWDFGNEHEKWPLRNIKLRHSRLIMYGGLLMLLGECSRERKDKVGWLHQRLHLTPLERIASVYVDNGDTNFFRLAGFYDTFLRMLSNPTVREELNVDPAQEGSYDKRYDSPSYATLKANSDGLVAELIRFVLGRRGVWSERFFEYLIF